MALSKDKKAEVVAETAALLDSSKMTVLAKYQGTSVKAMQELRRQTAQNGTKVRVIKNRLFKLALDSSDRFKSADTTELQGQLLYAFNPEDEVAPAQSLAAFAKTESQLEFVGAYNADGQFISSDDVKALASLPSKETLRAQLVGTIGAPLTGFIGVMSGNIRGVMNVLNARADQIK